MLESIRGLYINIDAKAEDIMSQAMDMEAKHRAEVAVSFRSQTREFTLAEFLEKLGFAGKKDSKSPGSV